MRQPSNRTSWSHPKIVIFVVTALASSLYSGIASTPAAAQRTVIVRDSYAVASYRRMTGSLTELRGRLLTQRMVEAAARDEVHHRAEEVERLQRQVREDGADPQAPENPLDPLGDAKATLLAAQTRLTLAREAQTDLRREMRHLETALLDFLGTTTRLQAAGRIPNLQRDPYFRRELDQLTSSIQAKRLRLREWDVKRQWIIAARNRERQAGEPLPVPGSNVAKAGTDPPGPAATLEAAAETELEALASQQAQLHEALGWDRRLHSAVQALLRPVTPAKTTSVPRTGNLPRR